MRYYILMLDGEIISEWPILAWNTSGALALARKDPRTPIPSGPAALPAGTTAELEADTTD